VQSAVKEEKQLLAFIDARGGCGKTFMTNVILSAVRSSEPGGCVALATATTGIAANLLDLGRTFHSRLKAPLTLSEESTLQISGQSSLAKLVRMAKMMLIDEATMLDRRLLEALDRSLRDLMNNQNKPFGGKTLLLAGDFRQCLPVVKGANRAQTTSHCINKSYLWQHFEILRLTENMRVRASGDPELEAFDQWTLSIGNGSNNDEAILIPDDMVTEIVPNTPTESWLEEESMKKFCKLIFPDLETNILIPGWLEGRAILTPTNNEVCTICLLLFL
jgi:ATP-dependent DNA helicase PIF1